MNVDGDQRRIESLKKNVVNESTDGYKSKERDLLRSKFKANQNEHPYIYDREAINQGHPLNGSCSQEGYIFVDCTPASIFDKKIYRSMIETDNRTSIRLGEFKQTGTFMFKAGILKVPNGLQECTENLSEIASILLSLDAYSCAN
ncbi:hypothetical protein MDAP_000682 [Mitosporidium daphniae]|uniref:Uncharacterized protein n=1 Tax=Mitosporidium daphniae TaxID=1485682 RepID=A0A098VSG4_9MICR|nr:uncharacterized protein DI09_24p60 [Mitosporidium daphniae]KGG51885.1 hypothetical protein DI09_24p60 [Mitosporidium daphniae]|eukprot:XP_013238346.1 uncharacterized protein DI09_24p60 [Mitosporidium daphniae]